MEQRSGVCSRNLRDFLEKAGLSEVGQQHSAQPFGCPSGDLHFYPLRSEAKWVQQPHSSQNTVSTTWHNSVRRIALLGQSPELRADRVQVMITTSLSSPWLGQNCVNLGSPAWVTAGWKGGRTHRHSIFLHLASWPSLVPGKLNPACSYCCKWGTLCSLWAHCMGFQIKLSLNLQNEYRKDPLSSHLSRKLFMCFAVVFLLNTMHHQTVSVPGSFFFLKENAQFEFSVRPDLL